MKPGQENNKQENLLGWFCSYTPVEIIRALGFKPYRILPPLGRAPQADGFFVGNLCPYVKVCLESALAGRLPGLLGVLLVPSCNAMIHLSNLWRDLKLPGPVWILDVPRSYNSLAVEYFSRRLKEVAYEVAAFYGRHLREEDLWETIEEERRHKELFKMLLEERAAGRIFLRGTQVLNLLEDGLKGGEISFDKGKMAAVPVGRPRLLLIGSLLPAPLLEIIEQAGAISSLEDACTGWRFLPGEAPRVTSPYTYLAHLYLSKPPCPRMVADKGRRRKYLQDLLSRYRIDGAIYHVMKFCDAGLMDWVLVKEELEMRGIPVLRVEGDYTGGSRGQWSTRVEAFLERLRRQVDKD
ncbi:Benzoyl-CoA reductase/2-hydroxyglutaryl-CoA dehydratase subunit, BcrC/BadD/HgdB [Thermanaeromonas toyohensis ToBE]|uniref:Benzoyl-CoA reductase/2-hydroxyglutaryl-CoA dehydratase subunit, BcrC/BadD/HgdB n=1 Tax=Thermanaeromonas toyohensis ToBE TaxID=698762 RepID=A0A1W1VB53_9FIRM|nr:2-hydroxyacyl-CoA dehydratase family protein [Thermanaeromonas toyohensis]SMB90420.1 Benzoyl-CoA reductase/2-hydroxyglutaryl-CoA dehydratase subunit, BcrC/BadD/HgdB [Thermanaeromonas toyohensis ToBE]